jgi:hypothetical protein
MFSILRRVKHAGHVARMEGRGIYIGFWWRDGKADVGGRIILKWILEISNGMVWTGFI